MTSDDSFEPDDQPADEADPETPVADTSVATPHDALFKLVFGRPEHVASHLRSVLPAELLKCLDLDGLRRIDRSFVDRALRQRHTDALFATTFNGTDVLVYVLDEHVRDPDELISFKLAQYLIRIWEDYLRETGAKRLPMIIPIVIYQGKSRWHAPRDLDLINLDAHTRTAVGDLMPRWRYVFDDVTHLDEPALLARRLTPAALVTLVAMREAPDSADATVALAGFLEQFRELLSRPDGHDMGSRPTFGLSVPPHMIECLT